MSSPDEIYQKRIDLYQTQARIIQRKSNLTAFFRLFAFLAFAVGIYLCVTNFKYVFLFITLIFFTAFILLVKRSFRLKDQKLLLEKMLFINTNELQVLQHQPNRFDNGQSFQTQEDDLDIFGPGSVFHLLNRTTTGHGKEKLAGLLKQPLLASKDIAAYQHAVKVLAEQIDKRQLLTAHGLLHEEKEGDLRSVSSWLETGSRLHQRSWINIARWLIPIYNIACIFFYLSTDNYLPLLAGVIISWIIIGAFSKYINAQHYLLSRKQEVLNQYRTILKIFSTVEPESSVLLQQLGKTAGNAHLAIHKLSKLSDLFDQRLNALVLVLLNSFLLYDIHCMVSLEKWKEEHKGSFGEWISGVGSIECFNALATHAFNNPDYNYPRAAEGKPFIKATGMAHPLIPARERIANDFEIGENDTLQLITGSNMSGKSTFLRTIGVNILLAQCGLPVCAASFSFTPLRILSSIRISDSLQEHTSYFMAELKRLQQIIRLLGESPPALVLIDEILRGTNSEDKTHGSEQFIKKLLHHNCLALFATHDLSLSKLENEFPEQVGNYCFESEIRQGELYFDYRLRKGVARNKNASFLMNKMGII
jgi:hypothetical protein